MPSFTKKFSGVTILQGVEFSISYCFLNGPFTTVQRYCAACDTFFIFSVSYRGVEFSGLQILKYCIQRTFFGFLNVDEKEKKLQNFVV